jgi:hypothetical protein
VDERPDEARATGAGKTKNNSQKIRSTGARDSAAPHLKSSKRARIDNQS